MDDLQRLIEIEAIKQLKARYMRAVDTKDWALLRSVFAPDARSEYSGGAFSFDGREQIVSFLESTLDSRQVISMHHAHTPEIEILSESTARGLWYLEDKVFNTGAAMDHIPGKSVLTGTGIYRDEYEKVDGNWFISVTGYERIFERTAPDDPNAAMTTRWSSEGGA